ncbi:MAG: hypothetical protein ACFFDW_02300 [Candidatus Thorarchaeota archaeon]
MSDDNNIQVLKALNSLVQLFYEDRTLQKICEVSIEIIKNNLRFDLGTLRLFNYDNKLLLRANFGLSSFEAHEISLDNVIKLFPDGNAKYIHDDTNFIELRESFNEISSGSSFIINPIIFRKQVIGFLTVGYNSPHKFSSQEMLSINLYTNIFGCNLARKLLIENFQSQTDKLKEITKQLRHDFANDIQSIALALELLTPTDLTEEQQKYVKILNNAKQSAIDKISDLRSQKQNYEKDIIIDFGYRIQ